MKKIILNTLICFLLISMTACDNQLNSEIKKYISTIDGSNIDVIKNSGMKMNVRLPYFEEDSDLATELNQDINDKIKEAFDSIQKVELQDTIASMAIDYEANILNNILSVKIMLTTNYSFDFSSEEILCVYNVDITNQNMKKITHQEIFKRMDLEKEQIMSFSKKYLNVILWHYASGDIDGLIKVVLNNFDQKYINNELFIYSKPNSDKFFIDFGNILDDCGIFYIDKGIELTLANSELEMAMLSKPNDDVLGVICVDYYHDKLFDNSILSNIAVINTQKDYTLPMYIKTFDNNTNIQICDVKLDAIDTIYGAIHIPKIIKSKQYFEDNTNQKTYLYYSAMPNTYPTESVIMTNNTYSGQIELCKDLKDDYSLHYIYKNVKTGKYVNSEHTRKTVLSLNQDNTFTVDQEFWQGKSINISKGLYITTYIDCYNKYLLLLPCKDDIKNGAEAYYVFSFNQDVRPNTLGILYAGDTKLNYPNVFHLEAE